MSRAHLVPAELAASRTRHLDELITRLCRFEHQRRGRTLTADDAAELAAVAKGLVELVRELDPSGEALGGLVGILDYVVARD